MESMTEVTPVEITRADTREIRIKWQDGHESVYPARGLRLGCACAGCVEEMTGRQILDLKKVPREIDVQDIKPSGRYGLHIAFTDGHGSGIYICRRLRENCPCEQCRADGSGTEFDDG